MSKNYDSEFCGNVPLNFINLIQPYGLLIVLDKSNFNIIQVSENIQNLFGISSSEFLNKNISEFIEENKFSSMKHKLLAGISDKIPVNFSLTANGNTIGFLAIAHNQERYITLELEKLESSSEFSFIYQEVKFIIARLKNTQSREDLFHASALEIKKISGFDKVMIYQFDKDWNGLVIAEEKEPEMDSYLGLRFPASDIPKQARELYFKNPYRFIPDRSYTAVNLNPVLNPITYKFTDLSECNIRSVAPVHLEYLKNMRVESSMSTPIIKDKKLWGLIACHHRTAKYLNYDMRSAFELVSNFISTELSAKQNEMEYQAFSQINQVQTSLYKFMRDSSLVDGMLSQTPSILDLLNVPGAAVVYNDKIRRIGKCPDEGFIREMCYWLKVNNMEDIYSTNTIQYTLDNDASYKDTCSGFIAIPISTHKGEFVLGFRPEVIETVHWGGNPNEAITFDSDHKNYHPRNSFTIWKETVKHTSAPWEEKTLEAAKGLRNSILEILIRSSN